MRMNNILVWAAAITLMLGAGATSTTTGAGQDSGASSQRGPAGETFAPIAVEELEPCCQSSRSERTDRQTGGNRGKIEVPRRSPIDPATLRRLKEEADFDPRVPVGSEVALAEEALLSPSAPRIRTKFEGLNANEAGGDGFTFLPPDTIVAAGPNEILKATNSALRLSSRTNTDVEIQSLNDHFGVKTSRPTQARDSGSARLAGDLFDPKVYYDRLSNRFFVVALFQNDGPNQSFIYLSVSRSRSVVSLSDGWCNYRIRGKRSNSWADYPGLGMNGQLVVISADNFKFANKGGNFANVYFFVVDKIALVDNAASCPSLKLFVFKAPREASGSFAFTVQPAQHYTESELPGDPLFMVSAVFGTSTRYGLWQFTTSATAARPSLSRISLTGDLHSLPPQARQKGGGIRLDTGDNRMMQAAFRDGELWATHATGCNLGAGPTESCIRVLQITPGGASGTSALSGTIDFQATVGRKNEYYWWPGIAVNRLGDVVVVFQRSSKKLFLSSAYNGKKARATKMDAVVALGKGKCNSQDTGSGSLARTGDYVGAQTDPVDNLGFWIAGEFSRKVKGLSGCNWSTQIANARY